MCVGGGVYYPPPFQFCEEDEYWISLHEERVWDDASCCEEDLCVVLVECRLRVVRVALPAVADAHALSGQLDSLRHDEYFPTCRSGGEFIDGAHTTPEPRDRL